MGFVRKVALLLMCLAAQASLAADQGFYFGLSAGQSKYDFDYEPPRVTFSAPPAGTVIAALAAGGLLAASGSFTAASGTPVHAFWLPGEDDKSNAFSALVGYRIFPYAAVELAYTDLGTLHEYQPAFVYARNLVSPALSSELESRAMTVSALATIPLTEHWDAYLRGGALFAKQKVSHSSSALQEATTYGSDTLLFGAGAQWDFNDHWTARLDFQRYNNVGEDNGIGAADIDVWSLGVLFRL